MSPKFCFLVILGLIALIENSESIKCYGCTSIVDGENCHSGNNLREDNCPLQKYCAKVTGMSMYSANILDYLLINFFFHTIQSC